MTPGSTGYTGLRQGAYGPQAIRLARAPVDDGGGPGKMSLKMTTSHGKAKKRNRARCSGPNLRQG